MGRPILMASLNFVLVVGYWESLVPCAAFEAVSALSALPQALAAFLPSEIGTQDSEKPETQQGH